MASFETQVLRSGKTIEEVCKASGMDTLPEGDLVTPSDLIDALRKGEQVVAALGILAHALPTREAVWWAWSCVRDTAGDEPPPKIQASLDATGQWIKEPSDENRRAAYDAAQEADLGTAAGCVGAAAFFTGDTLGPADQPPVPPEEYMAAKALAGSLLFAAADEPDEMLERLDDFVGRGLEVADRVSLWHSPEG
jgi:hypothetical protein